MNDGDFAGAAAVLTQARELTDDGDLLARIDLTAAFITSQQGAMRTGIERCHALLERPGLSPETRGLIWSQLGLMHKHVGDTGTALADYTRAIDLLRDSPELSRALLNRASLHLQRADAAQAVVDLTEAGGSSCAARTSRSVGPAPSTTWAMHVC